jgi:branched-chain amino acid transport system permease protein
MASIPAVIVFGVMLASVYMLLAAGLVLVFNILRIPNFAQASIYVCGGYLSLIGDQRLHVPVLAGLPAVFVLTGCLGIALWYLVFRPLRAHARVDMFVSALGVFIVLGSVFQLLFGPDVHSYSLTPPISAIPKLLPLDRLVVIVVCVVLMLALLWFIHRTTLGKAFSAVAQNPRAAESAGIDAGQISLLTLFIGTGLGGVAGSLLGGIDGVSPDGGTGILLKVIAILIVGGMGSLPGAIVAALLLGVLESVVSYYASAYSEIGFFVALLLILLIRPAGLLGEKALGEVS